MKTESLSVSFPACGRSYLKLYQTMAILFKYYLILFLLLLLLFLFLLTLLLFLLFLLFLLLLCCRSYLKLYTTMPISKLAAFMEIEERLLKTHLLAFKHKMKNVVWTKGSGSSGLEGELQSSSEVEVCPSVRLVVVCGVCLTNQSSSEVCVSPSSPSLRCTCLYVRPIFV